MPDQTLMDFFAGQRLTQVAQSAAIRRGVPRTLPAELFTPSATKPAGDQVEYIQYSGNRQGAQLVNRLSPARAVNMPGATRKYATALNTKEKLPVDVTFLDALKSSNPMIRENARRELVKRMADFNVRAEITRTNIVTSIFATGKLWADASGNVLPSSTGAALTIDYGVPTANQLTKDGSGSTYNIGDWSNAATDIRGNLKGLRKANMKANNYPLTTVLYGQSIPQYLASNTTLQQYFARNQQFRDAISMTGEIADGTLGFKWRPVELSYMVDASGNAQEWFATNFLGVMPDVSDDWYEFIEGGNLVPRGVASPGMSIDEMIGMVDVVNGHYSYAEMTTDPISINQIVGDSAVGILKVPNTYYFGVCS